MPTYEKRRILIWGKTAPELSMKYLETVCTGGVFEDGTPIRLFPIPFRYLRDNDRFRKYQWITAPIAKNTSDPRPESYRINCESIEVGETIPTDDMEWLARRGVMFQDKGWQFDSVAALAKAQEDTRQSLGIVEPKEILNIDLFERPDEEEISFEVKQERIRRKFEADQEQLLLFEELQPDELRGLEFVKNRVRVKWICGANQTHNMQIMDWEVVELQRREGDAKALAAVRKCLDLSTHATRFFLGNLKAHPTRFTIVGVWYPKKGRALLPGFSSSGW